MNHRLILALSANVAVWSLVLAACASVAQPPAAYQGPVTATVTFEAPAKVNEDCHKWWPHVASGFVFGSCNTAIRQVFMPLPCAFPSDPYAARMCLELAEVQGSLTPLDRSLGGGGH